MLRTCMGITSAQSGPVCVASAIRSISRFVTQCSATEGPSATTFDLLILKENLSITRKMGFVDYVCPLGIRLDSSTLPCS
jgi:hypothetical protein